MHAGDKPYVVAPSGQIELASRGLTLDAVNGIVSQLLPPDALSSLEEFGAIQHELAALPEFPGESFTVVAARGGDDVWVEIRRRKMSDDDQLPDDIFGDSSSAGDQSLKATAGAGHADIDAVGPLGQPAEGDERRGFGGSRRARSSRCRAVVRGAAAGRDAGARGSAAGCRRAASGARTRAAQAGTCSRSTTGTRRRASARRGASAARRGTAAACSGAAARRAGLYCAAAGCGRGRAAEARGCASGGAARARAARGAGTKAGATIRCGTAADSAAAADCASTGRRAVSSRLRTYRRRPSCCRCRAVRSAPMRRRRRFRSACPGLDRLLRMAAARGASTLYLSSRRAAVGPRGRRDPDARRRAGRTGRTTSSRCC